MSTDLYDVQVVVPTCGDPHVLIPTVERLLAHADGLRVLVVISANPVNAGDWAVSRATIEAMFGAGQHPGVSVLFHEEPVPVGFPRACNLGLGRLLSSLAPMVVVLNDDADVTPGWLLGLRAALETDVVRVWGEGSERKDRDARQYGRIGIAGPVTNLAAGIQGATLPPDAQQAVIHGLDQFAASWRVANAGNIITADFLSGFCLALTREAFLDLADEHGCLFDERFGIGGYEDNDLMVRAELRGWRCVVAGDTFIRHRGHQTLDRHFPQAARGLANRQAYLDAWAGHGAFTGRRLVACYRIGLRFAQDLHFWRASLAKTAELCDGIAILLTRNPLDMQDATDWVTVAPTLGPTDRVWLSELGDADAEGVAAATRRWVQSVTTDHGGPDITVETWAGRWNERDERNRAIELAEGMGADWVLSVDHDEIPEDRLTRAHVERLMSHPNPLVRSWDFGWIKHWDTPRLCRIDLPGMSGLTYQAGTRGFRLWRVTKAAPRRIMAGTEIGLHCGNAPDFDPLCKRVAAFRFRHLGYMLPAHRNAKVAEYQRLDPNPSNHLAMGSYTHLVREEGMEMRPYQPHNGIGLAMLACDGDRVDDVARWLDALHGVVDAAALTWTGDDPPGNAWVAAAARHGIDWIHHPLADDFAAARNVGLDVLATTGLAWALVLDPDESFADDFSACTSLRLMAECTDSWGFMFRFANLRPGGQEEPSGSENVRMPRIDRGRIMRYSGQVHETMQDALTKLRDSGLRETVRYAPFTVCNRGTALDDFAAEAKLRRYQRLIVEQLHRHPEDAQAWVCLGLQYLNDDRDDDAVECFRRAVLTAGTAYVPFQELGMFHARAAVGYLVDAIERLPPGHAQRARLHPVAEAMAKMIPDMPRVGLARQGSPQPQASPDLPPFPDELRARANASGGTLPS